MCALMSVNIWKQMGVNILESFPEIIIYMSLCDERKNEDKTKSVRFHL